MLMILSLLVVTLRLITRVESSLKQNFEMSYLGHLHCLQVLQTKEGIFLSQYKYACELLHCFHMEYCNPTPSPFKYEVKLFSTCTSPEVDATLYRQLVGSLLYLTHSPLTFPFPLVMLLVICKHLMKVTGKKQKEYFDIFEVQFSLGFITVQARNLCWLVSLIQIGPAILMIERLQVMFSVWDLDLSLGLVRNNNILLFLQ